MPGPDWLQFKHAMEVNRSDLIHSAKGTTWDDHKYIKKENGRYIYPSTIKNKSEIDKEAKRIRQKARMGKYLNKKKQEEFDKKFQESKNEIQKANNIQDKYEKKYMELWNESINDLKNGKIKSFVKKVPEIIDQNFEMYDELKREKLLGVDVPPILDKMFNVGHNYIHFIMGKKKK